jgi:type IV pilus biogenesis protein CpaD/CtpE
LAFNPLEWLNVARTIDRLLALETKHAALLEAQAKEIQALKDRVTKLEAREEILIAEAKGAAASAASGIASQHVAGLARGLGALEERVRNLDWLPRPQSKPSSD